MRLHGLSRRGFTAGSYLITLGTAARRHTNRAWSRRTILIPSRHEREEIERRERCMLNSIDEFIISEFKDNYMRLDTETCFIDFYLYISIISWCSGFFWIVTNITKLFLSYQILALNVFTIYLKQYIISILYCVNLCSYISLYILGILFNNGGIL